jgi:hypothetical protein
MRGANGVDKCNQHARPAPAVKRGLGDLVGKNNQLFVPDRGTAPAARCGRQTSRSRRAPMTSFLSNLFEARHKKLRRRRTAPGN